MQRNIKLSLWIIFFTAVIIILGSFKNEESGLISPLLRPNLNSVIKNSLNEYQGKFGIFIKNLKTNETFSLNENQFFKPASFYKLKLMVLAFKALKEGQLSEDDVLSADIKELNDSFDIATETAELTEGTIELTVKSALEQMITISHNYSALLLTKTLAAENLAEDTTAKEIAQFFDSLYKGEIIDAEYSKKMLDLLSRQKINDRISKYLPKEIKIAHKTADIDFFEHDAGVVFTPKGDYIIVILTESGKPESTGEKIAEISKSVYEYFNN